LWIALNVALVVMVVVSFDDAALRTPFVYLGSALSVC
jgi:hypothetical protein